MSDDKAAAETGSTPEKRDIDPAARRALEEAAARRAAAKASGHGASQPREIGGRDGPDPTRYGDWEKKGLISDF